MQTNSWRKFSIACGVAAALVVGAAQSSRGEGESSGDAALNRTRKLVRMLDDIYKGAIVLITKHYVTADSDMPAGEAFKALFSTMREKGWHEVRLIDATGHPIADENAPNDEFEREAIRQLKDGKPYYEQVVERDGKQYLRAATAIPVVMEKCTMCHEHYKTAKSGAAIGALGYTLKIE